MECAGTSDSAPDVISIIRASTIFFEFAEKFSFLVIMDSCPTNTVK